MFKLIKRIKYYLILKGKKFNGMCSEEDGTMRLYFLDGFYMDIQIEDLELLPYEIREEASLLHLNFTEWEKEYWENFVDYDFYEGYGA